MFELWKVYKGRKAAVAAISPFVEQSRRRLDEIPVTAWLDPYLVGFITTLITLIAKRRCDSLATSTLARVQSTAWGDITGIGADIIGEEVCLLSAAQNRTFEQGCENGVRFFQALFPEQNQLSADAPDGLADAFMNVVVAADLSDTFDQDRDRGANTGDLWDQYFETHVY